MKHQYLAHQACRTLRVHKLSKLALTCLTAFAACQLNASEVIQEVKFTSTGQSMWGTGDSVISIDKLSDPDFFGGSWDESGSFNIGDPTEGEWGTQFWGESWGKVGLEMGWKVDSGSLHSSLPFSFTLETPDRSELKVGETLEFGVTSATLDSDAFMRSVSPTIQAYADFIFEANITASAKGCYDAFFESGCLTSGDIQLLAIDNGSGTLGRELLSINIDPTRTKPDGEIRVLDGFKPLFEAGSTAAKLVKSLDDEEEAKKKAGLDSSGQPDNSPVPEKKERSNIIPEPKGKISFNDPLITVGAKLPEIDAVFSADRDYSLNSTGGKNNVLENTASDTFLEVALDVDTAASFLGISPPLSVDTEIDFTVGSIGASLDLIDLKLIPSLALEQDLSLSIEKVSVSYLVQDLVSGTTSVKTPTNLTDMMQIKWEDGMQLGITPTYEVFANVSNNTGLQLGLDFTMDFLSGSLGAEFLGFDIGNAKFDPLASFAFDIADEIGAGRMDVFNNSEKPFDLLGFSAIEGQTINIAISEAQFKSGTDIWDKASQWEGITGTPDTNTDVQLGKAGTDKYESHVTIQKDGEHEQVGNLTILAGSRLDIGGDGCCTVDNSTTNSLTITGDQVVVEGSIGVFTQDSLKFSTSKTTYITGTGNFGEQNGYISINNGGTLTSTGEERAHVVMTGTDIRQSYATRKNAIINLDLNLRSGAQVQVNGADQMMVNNSRINNTGTSYSMDGKVWLNNSRLDNIDNVDTFNVNNYDGNTNHSSWASGYDGSTINRGTVNIAAVDGGSSVLNMRSFDVDSGRNSLEFRNEKLVKVEGENAKLHMTANDTALTGGGMIELNGGLITTDKAGNTLTNGKQHTIQGWGGVSNFNLESGGLINLGEIWADGGNLDLTNNTLKNKGVIGVRSGGTVELNAQNIINADVDGSRFTLSSPGSFEARDGVIGFDTGQAISQLDNHSNLRLFNDLSNTQSKSTDIRVGNNATQSLTDLDEIHNYGTFELDNYHFNLRSAQGESAAFNNSGYISLNGNSTLTQLHHNYSGGLIEGHGAISARQNIELPFNDLNIKVYKTELVNDGIIRAKGVGKTLEVSVGDGRFTALTGNGRFEVSNGARLTFDDNRNPKLFDGNDGEFVGGDFVWAVIAGDNITQFEYVSELVGTSGVTTLKSAEIFLSGAHARFVAQREAGGQSFDLQATLENIDNESTLALGYGQRFDAAKAINNNGTIRLRNGIMDGENLSNYGIIHGYGTLTGKELKNRGDILVEGGTLNITRDIDNSSNDIFVGDGDKGEFGDTLALHGKTIKNGRITVKKNALATGHGSLSNVYLNNAGDILVDANSTSLNLDLSSLSSTTPDTTKSKNTGTIAVRNGGHLTLSGNALVNSNGLLQAENGTIRMNGIDVTNGSVEIAGFTIIDGIKVIGGEAALRGYGSLDNVAFKISGAGVVADINGERLTLSPSVAARLISATLAAENGGILRLADGIFKGSGGLQIEARNGSIVELKNVNISGATFLTKGSGKLVDIAASSFTNTNFEGNIEVASTGEFSLNGINRLTGSIVVKSGGEIILNDSTLVGQRLESTVDVDGNTLITAVVDPGDLVINSGSRLKGSGALKDLNIIQDGTIEALGANTLSINNAGSTFINNGNIDAIGTGGLILEDELVVNSGSVSVDENSQLTFKGVMEQHSGATQVEGQMTGGTLILIDGLLTGGGEIFANLELDESSILSSHGGGLTINGDVQFDGTMIINIVDETQFDMFSVFGEFGFSQTSFFQFNFSHSFVAFDGLDIGFLEVGSFLNFDRLDFSNISFTGFTTDISTSLGLSDDGLSLLLSFKDSVADQSVSEPRTFWVYFLVLASLLKFRRGQHG